MDDKISKNYNIGSDVEDKVFVIKNPAHAEPKIGETGSHSTESIGDKKDNISVKVAEQEMLYENFLYLIQIKCC